MKSSTDQIRKTIEIKAPPARVWRALTNYQEFSAWFGLDLESPFVAGQATRGRKMHPDHGPLTLELVVQTMEPERLFRTIGIRTSPTRGPIFHASGRRWSNFASSRSRPARV